MNPSAQTDQPLDRSIDRFLFAEGWRVTQVVKDPTTSLIEVTLTKTAPPEEGRTVTRSATSAGEATFKACSTARRLVPASDPGAWPQTES